MKIKVLLFIIFLIGGYVLVSRIDTKKISDIMINFPKIYLSLFFLLAFLISLMKSWRFQILLMCNNIKLGFWDNLRVFLASQTFTIFPGGEAMRGVLVHHECGVAKHRTVAPIITQAFLEVLTAGILMLLGSFFYNDARIPAIFAFIFLIIISFLFVHEKTVIFLTKKADVFPWFNKKISGKILKAQRGLQAIILDEKTNLPDKIFVRAFIASIATHMVGGLLIWSICLAIHIHISFFSAIFLYASSVILQTLGSIMPGGVGVTEGGMTGLLYLVGVSVNQALIVVLLFRSATFLFITLLGVMIFALFYAKDLFVPFIYEKIYTK